MHSNYPAPNIILGGTLKKISVVLTVLVLLTVGLMRRVKFDLGVDFSFLPPISAVINSFVALSLIFAFYFIRKKDVTNHRRSITIALTLSALFMICYVVYHFTTIETKYCGTGSIKHLYYFMLITHIVLAGVSLPFILFTFIFGYTFQVEKHRKLARYVFPVWLYVAVSGPICYLMLKPCYI